MNQPDRIKLQPSGSGFNLPESEWQAALNKAQADQIAGIRHAELSGDPTWRLHVAEISSKVNCHVHLHGHEKYEIVSGTGVLFSGPVEKTDDEDGFVVLSADLLSVKAGDSFVVPESFAHQLTKTGSQPLIIIFACPDTHLANDRHLLLTEN